MNIAKRRKAPQSLKKILGPLLNKIQQTHQTQGTLLQDLWLKAAGVPLAQHTKIHSLQGKTLMIQVENSTWMNELTYLKEQIKINVQRIFQENGILIQHIRFRI
jgi:predicted nucleic acid-binding Zn ribbon protein